MKILIFSDSHLADKFDPAKFRLLKSIIKKADRVVINGDFWDSWSCSFDQFILSEWQKLFPLLKQKKTIYLPGNHDPIELINKTKALVFADKICSKINIKIKNNNFVIFHGDGFKAYEKNPILKTYRFFAEKIIKMRTRKIVCPAVQFLEKLNITIFGQLNFINKLTGKHQNRLMKKIQREKNDYFICGHSHWPEKDEANKYLNSGYIKHRFASYIILDDNQLTITTTNY